MSFARAFRKVFFRSVFCAIGLFSSLASTPAEARTSACDQAIVLDLNSVLRLPILPPGDSFLRVEVFEPGHLSLDLSASGASAADPVLVPVRARCDGFMSPRAEVLERTLSSLLLGIESPGHYVFRLTSSKPSEILSGVKVRTAHASFGEDEEEIENEPDPFAPITGCHDKVGEDEEEIENEPDPFAPITGCPSTVGEDEEEIENEPDPFAPGGKSAALASTGICGLGQQDDHGDTFGCATALQPQVAMLGEVANDWGDDADVFRFVLAGSKLDLRQVDVSLAGETDGVATIFDRHGIRLGQQNFGDSEDSRWTGFLQPGVYFVRVEGGSRPEGTYGLMLDVSVP